MKAKYKMTQEQNIFVAERNIVDYIWKSAHLEGINITFPESNAIFEGISVKGVKVENIIKINNMKRAWNFLFDTVDKLADFDYMCRINMLIGSDGNIFGAGKVRAYDVRITGTNWQHQIPFEYDIRNEMADIAAIESATERAITLMLWGMRRQIFIDGNTRTAMLIANFDSDCSFIVYHFLIFRGCHERRKQFNLIKRREIAKPSDLHFVCR